MRSERCWRARGSFWKTPRNEFGGSVNRRGASMKRESKTVHSGERKKNAAPYTPVTTPIYTGTSYSYDSMETLDQVFDRAVEGPSYTRYGNPTVDALQE